MQKRERSLEPVKEHQLKHEPKVSELLIVRFQS